MSILDERREVKGWYYHPLAENNKEFSNFIQRWMTEWTGWAIESIFEVNMLVINPELVFCATKDDAVYKQIESIGMTPVHVPFRHRRFWDGGLHCLTVDTRRRGEQQDYWK